MFLTIKLYTHAKELIICIKMGFGIKITYKGWYAIKPTNNNNINMCVVPSLFSNDLIYFYVSQTYINDWLMQCTDLKRQPTHHIHLANL